MSHMSQTVLQMLTAVSICARAELTASNNLVLAIALYSRGRATATQLIAVQKELALRQAGTTGAWANVDKQLVAESVRVETESRGGSG